jgi:SAM-dependent methyltransferase
MNRDVRKEDRDFGTTIAQIYERDLVPLLFEPYAAMVAERVAARRSMRVLEIAAGTGALTRALCSRLPNTSEIIATDLNQAMLDRAIAVGTSRPVQWRRADALDLPFDDATADLVICQFGAMFFPDKPRAFAEARRVLTAGGALVFTVWDRIEENEFADTVDAAVAALFPENPPSFMRRTPHGYFDRAVIAAELRAAGFESPAMFQTLSARSTSRSARHAAVAFCEGTPLRSEIEARGDVDLATVTLAAESALARRFGNDVIDGKTQAYLVCVERD